MALTSSVLETRTCALIMCGHISVTHESSCMPRLAKPFHIHGTCGSTGDLPSKEAGSKAAEHVAASEPSRPGRRGPELSQIGRQSSKPWGTWQCRSPPEQGGRV
jgi:hypothetical protein